MRSVKSVIVNADDFGATIEVNRGIIETHERGIVTSASLMVYGAAATEAAQYARNHPQLGLGLHVDLRRWRVRRLPWSSVRAEQRLQRAVADELRDQLERFRFLVGSDPTHVDSHHHRHRLDVLRPSFLALAQELDVPLRHFAPGVRFCGDFYGHDGRGQPQPDAVSPEALIALLERIKPGLTEIGCHPGYPDGLRAWYRDEREQEVRSLCDCRVREAIDRLGVRLISFRELTVPRSEPLEN